MTALPIGVDPTDPPSMSVRVLDQEIDCGPSHIDAIHHVLIHLGPGPGIHAARGPAITSATNHRFAWPALPDGASPVAHILLLPAQCAIDRRSITLLNPDGTPRTSDVLDP